MDKLKALNVFEKVAQNASFTKASELLQLPRSTVSSTVQALEKNLGVRLFHRTTRRVSLTQEGIRLLERSNLILDEVNNLNNMFADQERKLSGTLRVSLPSRIAANIVAPNLTSFFDLYPNVGVDIIASDRFVDLVNDNIDMVVRVGELESSSLIAKKITDIHLVICASQQYLKSSQSIQTIEDLNHHQCIHYAGANTLVTSKARVDGWLLEHDAQERQVKLSYQASVNDAQTYIASAIAGLGLIQIPFYDVKELIEQKKLVQVLSELSLEKMPANILYSSRRHLKQEVKVFTQWFESLFKEYA